MIRFFILFAFLFVICIAMLAGVAMQYGYTLLDPQMQMIWIAAIAVAGYVAWRINGILRKREKRAGVERSGGGLFGRLFVSGKSQSQLAREARIATRRKKLIAEGKLDAEPEPDVVETEAAPTRVPPTASIQDKMAARRERVRRAKEQGK